MRNIAALIFFLICFHFSFAQNFGGNPSSLKWKQINTDTARVIFPAGMDSVANRVANIVHTIQRNYSNTIGNKIDKINIVLQKDGTVSNGYVALDPYRSEFYLTPPQDALELGAQNWSDNLAVHEFRHVQQYSNFNTGLTKTAGVLFGQNGRAVAMSGAVPDWFFEGDAVYNETMLSRQGRGRLPLFLNGYKTLYADNRQYNFMQLRNGSYKNYIPNHYQLGYLLVAYGREKYGDDFWKKVTQDAAAYKNLFYPFQHAVQKHSGLAFNTFFQNAISSYNTQWGEQSFTEPIWLTGSEKNNVVDYKYAYPTGNDNVVVLKRTNKDIPRLYMRYSNGTENLLDTREIAYDDYFSYNNGKIIFTALQTDSRWTNRDFSVIKVMDTASHLITTVTKKSRYFSPDISHDGENIVAVELKADQQCSVVFMNTSGKVQHSVQAKAGCVYSYPKFSADDKEYYVMERDASGFMALIKGDIKSDTQQVILSFENRVLGFPVVQGDTLLYTCSNNGRDEIWAYIDAQKKHYRLAGGQTGFYQGSLTQQGKIISSVFTSYGYRLAALQPQWQPVSNTDTLIALFVQKPFHKTSNSLLSQLPVEKYATTPYHKATNIFNFHSWYPFIDHPDYYINIYGQNVLNTFQSTLYYNYNSNEKFHKVGYTAVYGGWYLQPLVDVSNTWHRSSRLNADTTLTWNEMSIAAGLRLPLNFSGGKMYRNLTLSATWNSEQVSWTNIAKSFLTDRNIQFIQTRISYSSRNQLAKQQVLPRWGNDVLLQYRTAINKYTAHQFLASASVYMPGFYKTHAIVFKGAIQSRDTAGQYFYSNNFPFSRGYSAFDFPRIYKLGINYHLPLWLPDAGVAQIVFINRIRGNLFYDFTQGKSLRTGNLFNFRTAGVEIYFDTKWFNQQPLTIGFRYSRLLDESYANLSPNQWEIILPSIGIF